MSYEKAIQASNHVTIGTKQTIKALELGKAVHVYVAKDAEPKVTMKVIQLARITCVELSIVETMKQLGRACGIEVGAAAVAVCKED